MCMPKKLMRTKNFVSLGRIIRAQNEYSKEIENDLRNFLNISYKIMNSIFHIRYEMLNASERINIEKLRPKRKEIVLKILEYES